MNFMTYQFQEEGPGEWDFRDQKELDLEKLFCNRGYLISKANLQYLDKIRYCLSLSLQGFLKDNNIDNCIDLERTHNYIDKSMSNELRLHVLRDLTRGTTVNKWYYHSCKDIVHSLCGNELAMQKRVSLSINFPANENDILPIHADTWNGVSPYELNIWIPLVDCNDTMCLYMLEREKYESYKKNVPGLLKLDSDSLFNEFKSDLTWIEIRYGDILAFDQSLPHGYSLNCENKTHWSLNCRFKGLHTPYWDKKLGEYFMPITVKNCTRLGMEYSHPDNWI